MRNFVKIALAYIANFRLTAERRLSPKGTRPIERTKRASRTKTKENGGSVQLPGPPPVAPRPKLLPFYAPDFSWETFESFFCDFLAAGPELLDQNGLPQRITLSSLYGRRGDNQHGIDIRAEMASGEVWVFQCKHYKSWGPQDTKDAIKACTYTANRKFLLVTRQVSPETRKVVAKEKDWEIWDSDDISREFLARLSRETAARLLYTNFGPSWPKELLGLPGLGPFFSPDAKFAPFLKQDRNFHHRLALVGRKDWLQALDDFVRNDRLRVFLLCGRGGLGKSRILREWSTDFSSRHKGWTIKFVSDSPAEFGPALDSLPRPLILVFDDAHRLDEVRRILFSELPPRKDIKLLLSLRPGPITQIESELTDAGFDITQIKCPPALKRLSSEEALELSELALGPELAERFRLRLRDLSRDCPLLAVLAAELLKRKELADRDLDNTDEFRIHVFNGLLKEAKPVEDRFGSTRTLDFLRLLAVLAPVKTEAEFLKKAAAFLGGDTHPNQVADMLSSLDEVGLILTTGAGSRVTPDLLADHLAFTACYDRHGSDTTFVGRVFECFSPENFPRLMQHVAEAEWHALQENDSAQSVIEPIWQWFQKRFEACSFYERHEQIKQWANIAHLQPRRTLELAKIAVKLRSAPPNETAWLFRKEWDSHEYVLASLPVLLKPLAKRQPTFVGPCLDILWDIGRNLPPLPFNGQNHPIATIGEIASYEGGIFPAVQREVISWLKRLLSGTEWTSVKNSPAWLLKQMLHPFFVTSIEESWASGRTLHWRSLPLHLGNTEEFRDGVLEICRHILARKSNPLALAILNVLEHAVKRAQIPNYKVTSEFEKAWLIERRKALDVLAEIRESYPSPIVQFRLRQILLRQLQYDETEFRSDCRNLFGRLLDTLELRVLRIILGTTWDEFDRPIKGRTAEWHEEAERRREQFIRSTLGALFEAWPSSPGFFSKLEDLRRELFDLGFQPNFSVVFRFIADTHTSRALELADYLIANPDSSFGWAFGILVFSPTSGQNEKRLALCNSAIETGSDDLIIGAIECFTSWRREGSLPQSIWELIGRLGKSAGERVANGITRFVQLNDNAPSEHDWTLLASLPADTAKHDVTFSICSCAADLLEKKVIPPSDIAGKILERLEPVPALDGFAIEEGIKQFAAHFPGKVFLLIWRRYQHKRAGESDFETVPYDFDSIRLSNIMADPDAAAIIGELERRFIEGHEMESTEMRVLSIAIMQDGISPEPHLLSLLAMASTSEQLKRLAQFVEERNSWPIVLECVEFTRQLLAKAKAVNSECHKEIFSDLSSLPGSRGFNSIEPDEEWKTLVAAVEDLATRYASDPELGPFFAAALKHEKDWITDMRKHGIADEQAFDED